ncbi:hypothetical protein GCM10011344_41480 [Dokdonia pacifica]|nr:hypothetical protein [Dokdonia pacifica]GGG36313.1 hypothetical protein GCM10011344_41480 [Dokdonia pacifica]
MKNIVYFQSYQTTMTFSSILGAILALYALARKAIKNEPLKSKIQATLEQTNSFLRKAIDIQPTLIMLSIGKYVGQLALGSFVLIILTSFLPEIYAEKILDFFTSTLVICIYLCLAIYWKHNHIYALDEFFKNWYIRFLIILPLVVFIIDSIFNLTIFELESKYYIFSNRIILYIIFHISWILTLFLFYYILFWLITIVFYYPILLLLFFISYGIRGVNKYMDTHILDGIVALITIVLAYLKFFT